MKEWIIHYFFLCVKLRYTETYEANILRIISTKPNFMSMQHFNTVNDRLTIYNFSLCYVVFCINDQQWKNKTLLNKTNN